MRPQNVHHVSAGAKPGAKHNHTDGDSHRAMAARARLGLGLFLLLGFRPQGLGELGFGVALRAGRREVGFRGRALLPGSRSRLPGLLDRCLRRGRRHGLGSADDRLRHGAFDLAVGRHDPRGGGRPRLRGARTGNGGLFYRSHNRRLRSSAVPFGKVLRQSIGKCINFYFSRCHFPSTSFT